MTTSARLWRERLSTAAFLAILAGIAGWTGWLNLKNPLQLFARPTSGPIKHEADYIIEQFSITRLSSAGTMTTQIVAPKLIHYPDNDSADVSSPNVLTRNQDGTVTQIRANSGQLLRGGEQIELRDAVRIVRTPVIPGSEVLTLNTEALTIFPDTETLKSNVAVQGSRGMSVINAQSMVLDNITRTAEFSGKIESVVVSREP